MKFGLKFQMKILIRPQHGEDPRKCKCQSRLSQHIKREDVVKCHKNSDFCLMKIISHEVK